MATFTEVKTALDEIAGRTTENEKRADRAKALLLAAQADLAAMPGAYGAIIGEINQGAIDNPTDDAWQLAKAEKDQMVTDFNALKVEVDNLVTAIGA